MPSQLGNRIKEARRAAGFNNPESLAAALGVSVATVNRYEQGRIEPSLARLADISRLTKQPLGFFLAEEVPA